MLAPIAAHVYAALAEKERRQTSERATGLRYDQQFPLKDPQKRMLTYVPGFQSRVVPEAFPGMLFPGDEGPDGTILDSISSTDYNNIGPRLGFAWDVAGDGNRAFGALAMQPRSVTAGRRPR